MAGGVETGLDNGIVMILVKQGQKTLKVVGKENLDLCWISCKKTCS